MSYCEPGLRATPTNTSLVSGNEEHYSLTIQHTVLLGSSAAMDTTSHTPQMKEAISGQGSWGKHTSCTQYNTEKDEVTMNSYFIQQSLKKKRQKRGYINSEAPNIRLPEDALYWEYPKERGWWLEGVYTQTVVIGCCYGDYLHRHYVT